jgi:hypothetical protein
MVARYGYGDAFARHVDNNCCRGQGELCNGRVLTTVYYMQDADWDAETDGGCLRLFGSQQPLGEPMDTAATPLADDLAVMLEVVAKEWPQDISIERIDYRQGELTLHVKPNQTPPSPAGLPGVAAGYRWQVEGQQAVMRWQGNT